MQLTSEDKLILSCIKLFPSTTDLEQTNSLILLVRDWDYLTTVIIARGIGPLLYQKLPLLSNSAFIPEAVKTKLQQAFYKTLSRSVVLYNRFREIAEAFTLKGIPIIALKGIYLSETLYQNIGLRQFSDIDLLVKEEDGEKSISILNEMGYKPGNSATLPKIVENQFDMVHFPAMVLKGASIEIHIKLHRNTESYDLKVSEVWKNSIAVNLNGIAVSALSPNDLLIHLCLHLDKHFKTGHVQFTCFNDITNLLEKYSDTIDWTGFTELCRFYNCEKIVYLYIVMVNKYMNASIPQPILQKYSTLLTQKEELLFCKYLKGYTKSNSYFYTHFRTIKVIHNPLDMLTYLWGILFPSKAFMVQVYKIKNPRLVLFYYPYRYYIGLKGMMGNILNNP